MKHLKLFLTLLLAMTSVMVQAMSYPDLVKGHNRTANQPYQEFSLRLKLPQIPGMGKLRPRKINSITAQANS